MLLLGVMNMDHLSINLLVEATLIVPGIASTVLVVT